MAWFSRLSVWTKLMLSFVAVSAITCVVGYIGSSRLSLISGNMKGLYENELKGCIDASDMGVEWLSIARDTRQAILVKDSGARQSLNKSVEDSVKKFNDALTNADTTFYRPEDKAKIAKLREMFPQLIGFNKKAIELADKNKETESVDQLSQARTLSAELIGIIRGMAETKRQAAEQAYISTATAATNAQIFMISCIIGGVVMSLSLGFWIARWFTKAIVEVDDISNSVAAASQQLAAASEQLSSGAQQSASSLEETASSLEEITATVRQNADNADQANQLANSSRETAEKGGAVVANAVKAMGEINQASRKIADIITTIDEIAFQTNLLALNAAVEAARAGEQGRGFAVVAGEVRNLAQRSATAAREIKGLIQDSVNKVESGSELVNKSGETLGEIVSSVKRVTDIVAEIAAASREQTAGIEQINKAVAQMDQVTQSNASQTEEMSGTAVALSSQAEQLQSVVAQFNLKKQEVKASGARTSNRAAAPVSQPARNKPQPRKVTSTRPQSAKPARELELAGAGVGHDGFEEF